MPVGQAEELHPVRGGQLRVRRRFRVDRRRSQGQEGRFNGGHPSVSSGTGIKKPFSHIIRQN